MTNQGNPQQEIKYQWTQESKDEYNKYEKNLLRLLTKIAAQKNKKSPVEDDDLSVVTNQSKLNQLTPCVIDGLSDIPYDTLSAHKWIGNFPEEVSVEFFKGQDKLTIVYCGSNDPNLNDYFQRFDNGELLSVFISFKSDGNPWLFTITSGTNCLNIRIEDDNFITGLFNKLQNCPIVFAQQVCCTRLKQEKLFEQFLEEKSKFVNNLEILKLDDVSPMFKGIEKLSFTLLGELIACPYYRPGLPTNSKQNLFDDKNIVTLLLSRAFETNFLVKSIEKLEQAEKLERSDKISYQQLVDTCFCSTEKWEDNKTINVEFSQNEEFSITFATQIEDVFDDWLDMSEYYYFHPFKSNEFNYFVVGNWANKKILILEDALEDINDSVIEYFSFQYLNFVVDYGPLPAVFTELKLSKGYVIKGDIFKRLESDSPLTKITSFHHLEEGNSSVTLMLRMAYKVYLMMKTFNEQNTNNTEQKQELHISSSYGPHRDGNSQRGGGNSQHGGGNSQRGGGKRPQRGGGNSQRGGGKRPPRGGGNP